jgi:aminoglycoside 3-N-acetyltransferase
VTKDKPSKQLKLILENLGVIPGRTIYLSIDMSKVLLPKIPAALNRKEIQDRESKWCKFILDHILEAIGDKGTLLVPTFSYSCGATNRPFQLEITPSEVGPFTEYFRQYPGVIRSLHPIFSIAGLGPKASTILENTGKSAFGILSPFGRLGDHDTLFLMLGTDITNSLTYMHHLEHNYGCSHRFHKIFHSEVFKNNKLQQGPWSAYVSYLGINVESDLSEFESDLKNANTLNGFSLNGHINQSVSIKDIDSLGYEKLDKNPSYFCSRSIEVRLDESETSQSPSEYPVADFKLMQKVAN